ncbi:hypothetical protein APHAL10511_004384 [Amanita phalloides]|nr:hypothetical protein APHAL10511_004384 [Amanita phalloides]
MFSSHSPSPSPPSPPSSPSPCVDSSPLSSPLLSPTALDDCHINPLPPFPIRAPLSHVVDPFAASVVPDWIPPDYERRSPGSAKTGKRTRHEQARDPFSTPPGSAKKMRYKYRANRRSASSESMFGIKLRNEEDNFISRDEGCIQCEEQIWEDASIRVFDGNGNIDLSNLNLTYIPRKFIEDLENIYIPPDSLDNFRPAEAPTPPGITFRPFVRSLTAPADVEESGSYHFPSDTRRITRQRVGRVRTVSDMSLGLPKGEIALYLMANQITKLPKEFFNLQKLTILSIRHNNLTSLPPEIRYLTSLHTLNIAYNQLRYLPSEMLEMALSTLTVHPNPFLEPEPVNAVPAPHISLAGQVISRPTYILPRVIPLVELCLRKLLSPASKQPHDTNLAAHYELPLQEFQFRNIDPPGKKSINIILPTHLRRILDACAPGSVYDLEDEEEKDSRYEDDHITESGYCPRASRGAKEEGCGVFIRHAEERFSWESNVANVEVGARVPIRWRGCNWGCLEFLDEAAGNDKNDDNTEVDAAVMTLDVGSELGFDD